MFWLAMVIAALAKAHQFQGFGTKGTYVNIQLLTVVYYQKDSESRRG